MKTDVLELWGIGKNLPSQHLLVPSQQEMRRILTITTLDQWVPTFGKVFEEIILTYVPLKVSL